MTARSFYRNYKNRCMDSLSPDFDDDYQLNEEEQEDLDDAILDEMLDAQEERMEREERGIV